jgi:hypothetical protein
LCVWCSPDAPARAPHLRRDCAGLVPAELPARTSQLLVCVGLPPHRDRIMRSAAGAEDRRGGIVVAASLSGLGRLRRMPA